MYNLGIQQCQQETKVGRIAVAKGIDFQTRIEFSWGSNVNCQVYRQIQPKGFVANYIALDPCWISIMGCTTLPSIWTTISHLAASSCQNVEDMAVKILCGFGTKPLDTSRAQYGLMVFDGCHNIFWATQTVPCRLNNIFLLTSRKPAFFIGKPLLFIGRPAFFIGKPLLFIGKRLLCIGKTLQSSAFSTNCSKLTRRAGLRPPTKLLASSTRSTACRSVISCR